MRKALRWRYYCEFCNKAGMSGFHIAKHERGCTLNPDRKCGMCNVSGGLQQPIADLMNLLPSYSPPTLDEHFSINEEPLRKEIEAALPSLRELAGNCPACIMAALRQKKIPVPLAVGFDFTKECKAIWDEINAERRESESCYYG